MDKFSNVQNINDEDNLEVEELFTGDYVNVLKYKDIEIVKEGDFIAVVPYFIQEGTILMRSEYLPSFQYRNKDDNKYKDVTNYLSIITGKIEEGETPQKTIRRELYEEGGLVISSLYDFEFEGPFFPTKRSTNHIYLSIVQLNINDYRQTTPPTDGTKGEQLSRCVRISLGDIDEILCHDLFTKHLLQMIKVEYNIK